MKNTIRLIDKEYFIDIMNAAQTIGMTIGKPVSIITSTTSWNDLDKIDSSKLTIKIDDDIFNLPLHRGQVSLTSINEVIKYYEDNEIVVDFDDTNKASEDTTEMIKVEDYDALDELYDSTIFRMKKYINNIKSLVNELEKELQVLIDPVEVSGND